MKSLIILVLTSFLFLPSASGDISYSKPVTGSDSIISTQPKITKEKKHLDYKQIAGWTLGLSFSELQPKIKNMDHKIPTEDKKYDSTVVFFDKKQILIFEGGILEYVITTTKGQGIKNVVLVGDSLKQVLNKLGNPLQKYKDTDGVYYGYGTSYDNPELQIKIKNYRVIEISLENPTVGFVDENRVVLAYLHSIGDLAVDYYVCNACSIKNENSAESNTSSILTLNEMKSIFEQINKDMKSLKILIAKNSTIALDYQSVFTDQQAQLEQKLDEAEKNSEGSKNQVIIKQLNLYSTLVYDAYNQKELSLTPNLSEYDKSNYEQTAFISITDAMTIHNVINAYLKTEK
ncbi:hypothetical protein [Paenibacillus sp. Z6-24]